MNIIIDSNILFSALIKDSTTRQIILKYDNLFLFPEYIFEEMERHQQELFEKSQMNKKDFSQLLQIVLKKVIIVPNESLINYRKEALEIIKDIDKDDTIFIGCALAYPNSIIWSDDKKLKLQNKIKVLNTKEIIKLL